jgi:hypothetical protein
MFLWCFASVFRAQCHTASDVWSIEYARQPYWLGEWYFGKDSTPDTGQTSIQLILLITEAKQKENRPLEIAATFYLGYDYAITGQTRAGVVLMHKAVSMAYGLGMGYRKNNNRLKWVLTGTTFIFILSVYAHLCIRFRDRMELRSVQKQLSLYTRKLAEKNDVLNEFKDQVMTLRNSGKQQEIVAALQQLKSKNIITEKDWLEFKALFEKVHPGFLKKLFRRYPDLTQAEIRLAVLIRLNVSTKTMAGMLGISPQSVRQSRYRLRKKFDLPAGHDLNTIINSL